MTVFGAKPPPLDERLLESVLQAATEGRQEVVRLTDEELTVLEGSDVDQLAPRPWYSALADSERDLALAVALRGLVARGLAVPSAVQSVSGDVTLAVTGDISAVLAARRAASAVLMAQRRTADASSFRALYLQGADVVVEEDVSPGGLHTLAVVRVDEALDRLVELVDPQHAATADGPTVSIELADVAEGKTGAGPVDDARWVSVVSAVITVAGQVVERQLSVYSLPDTVYVAHAREDEPVSDVYEVGRRSLLGRLAGLLDGAR